MTKLTLEQYRATPEYQNSMQDLLTHFAFVQPLTYRVCFSYSDSTGKHVELVDYTTVEETLEQFARVGATVHTIYTISDQLSNELVYTKAHATHDEEGNELMWDGKKWVSELTF